MEKYLALSSLLLVTACGGLDASLASVRPPIVGVCPANTYCVCRCGIAVGGEVVLNADWRESPIPADAVACDDVPLASCPVVEPDGGIIR